LAISDSQIEVWSHQGAVDSSSRAYASVKAAVEKSPRLAAHSLDIYLQGSYRNHTNTRGDSDIDVVVHCTDSFFHDTSRLDATTKRSVEATFNPAKYPWLEFRSDVLAALASYFGTGAVTNGNKCLKVAGAGGTGMHADVVPAVDHRLYWLRDGRAVHLAGVGFRTQKDSRVIANYPKRHFDNGAAKNQRAGEMFKPTARVFKNMKSRLVELGWLDDEVAPSYFIECLVYNAPDQTFNVAGWQNRFVAVFNAITNADLSSYKCVHEIRNLFDGSLDGWDTKQAKQFLSAIERLWNS